jgi:hypothetical protein
MNLNTLTRYAVEDRHGVSQIYDWTNTPSWVRRNLTHLANTGRIHTEQQSIPTPHTILHIT